MAGNPDRSPAGPGGEPLPAPEDLLREGKALQRIQTGYVTAVAVQRPRDLDAIVVALEKEAEYAGPDWFYTWTQKNRQTGTDDLIEGGGIGMAYAIVREWGNCAIDCDDVREKEDATYFFPQFIDVEKGVTIQRPFRAALKATVHGKYDSERKADIRFQIATSKACRNVIFAGTPRWLERRLLVKCKKVIAADITAEGKEVSKKRCLDAFAAFEVTPEMLADRIGTPVAQWSTDDLVKLSGILRSLKDAQSTVPDLFPDTEKKPTAPAAATGPVTSEKAAGATQEPPADSEAAAPAPDAAEGEQEPRTPDEVPPADAPGQGGIWN